MSVLFQKANLTDKSLNLANFNRMVDYLGRLANMTSPNMMIDRNPNGYVLKVLPSGSTMSYSDWAFGFSISGAVVSLNAGEGRHGKRNIIDVTATTKTLTADHQYLWLEYKIIPRTLAWAEPNALRPQSDDITFRLWFYQFRLVGGVGSIEKIGHLGNVEIPSIYG